MIFDSSSGYFHPDQHPDIGLTEQSIRYWPSAPSDNHYPYRHGTALPGQTPTAAGVPRPWPAASPVGRAGA